MMKNENSTNNNNYDTIKVTNGHKSTVTTTANVVVVKSEPGDDSSPSSSPGLEEQARKSPIKIRDTTSPFHGANKSPPPNHNGHTNGNLSNGRIMSNGSSNKHNNKNGHGSDSDSVASVKSERSVGGEEEEEGEKGDTRRDEKMETDFEIRSTGPHSMSSSPRSLLSSASSTGSRGSPPSRPHNGLSSSSPRRSPPHQNGLRDTNPSLIITKSNKSDSYSQRSSPMSHHSGSSRGGSPPNILNLNSHHLHHLPPHLAMAMNGHGPPPPGLFHATQLHARLTENRRDRDGSSPSSSISNNNANISSNNGSPHNTNMTHHLSHDKGGSGGDPPLSVVTSTSLSFHQGSLYRINGVRPEVISGGAVTPVSGSPRPTSNGSGSPPSGTTPNPSHQQHHHQNHPHHQSHPNNHHQLLPNGTSAQHLHPHSNGIALNGLNHHLPFPIQGNRKSPNSHMSRSPNSSPSNSSSSGSIQHSPGSTGSGGGTIIAGGNIGMVNSSTPQANGTHHVNLSRTPTVIMGKS